MSEVEDDVYEVNMHFSMKCTIYTPGKAGRGGQPGKEKTSTRTKEADLQVSSDDHAGFLNAVSDAVIKEPLVELKDSSKPWPFKYYGGRIKVGNAPEVENDVEFKKFVIRLEDELQGKEIFIVCDEKVIRAKSRPKRSRRAQGEEEEEEDEDEEAESAAVLGGRVQERDLSRRDTSMGHFRKILERTYKDDVSGGLSVPLADNSPFRLSPFLATEWASAMDTGHASLFNPPSLAQFGKIHSVGMHPELLRKHGVETSSTPRTPARSSTNAVPATPAGGIGELSGFLNAVTSLLGQAHGKSTAPQQRPDTPEREDAPASSPPASPTLISRFVRYASEKGISDAELFEPSLEQKKFGPDVLPDIPETELELMGFAPGDAIRLKRKAKSFWDRERKKPRTPGSLARGASMPAGERVPTPAVAQLISYQYFHQGDLSGGEGFTFYKAGVLIKTGRRQPKPRTAATLYYDEARDEYLPIPAGFEPPMPPDGGMLEGMTEEDDDM